MSYRRIEVNLLPPELQPGPTVRSALIINITLILATFFTMGLSAALGMYRYAQYLDDIEKTNKSIASLQPVKQGYEQLQKIDAAVLNYGRIIGIASTDYVDVPVLLSHLSYVVPDGVYLTSVTNTRAGNPSAASVLDANRVTLLSMTFRTSRHDLKQVIGTLEALKQDEVFQNCALTNAELNSEDLLELSDALGMDIQFDLPSSSSVEPQYNFYEFVIRAEIRRPVEDERSRVLRNDLDLFKASEAFGMPPATPPATAGAASGGPAAAPGNAAAAAEPTREVEGGPPGVTATPNRGGGN